LKTYKILVFLGLLAKIHKNLASNKASSKIQQKNQTQTGPLAKIQEHLTSSNIPSKNP